MKQAAINLVFIFCPWCVRKLHHLIRAQRSLFANAQSVKAILWNVIDANASKLGSHGYLQITAIDYSQILFRLKC